MFKHFFLLIPAAAAMTLVIPSVASAGHDHPLYEAAECYREAAIHFEKEVDSSRHSDRDQRRAVDSLEDLTSDLRSAARRPERSHQLLHEWHQIQRQFVLVEAIIFRDPHCPLTAEVWPCWQEVVQAHHRFGRLLAVYSRSGHGHGHDHGHHDQQPPRIPRHDVVPTIPQYDATPTIPRFNSTPVIPRYNSPERFRQQYGQPQAGVTITVPRQNETGTRYQYQAPLNQVHRPSLPTYQQTFRPDRQSLYGSPSQRQLESGQPQRQRSETYRRLNNAATIGALISRFVD